MRSGRRPAGATTGTPVTLDGTASTGDGTLTCTWSFENQDGSIVWETVNGCRITKTFLNADTKYVELTVTDADGDTDSNRQSFTVTRPARAQLIPLPSLGSMREQRATLSTQLRSPQ